MKTTIDLPDDLLTEVKIEAARQHKKLKELVPDLVRARRAPAPADRRAMAQWLKDWVKLGEVATKSLPAGPTATEILAADRRRLEDR
jgi:hypothetical protein